MSISARRRKYLLGFCAIYLTILAGPPSLAATLPAAQLPPVDDALFTSAIAFMRARYLAHGHGVVHGPVSRLQREFLLGYRDALALAEALEEAGFWRIASSEDGRVAVLQNRPAALPGCGRRDGPASFRIKAQG